MQATQALKNKLYEIIEDARFAPSVHNTQPWKVAIADNVIKVSIDPKHELQGGDPTGRQTIISLGIFAEAIVLCARERALEAHHISLDGEQVMIEFSDTSERVDQQSCSELLRQRATDRSIYRPVEVTDETIRTITTSNQQGRVKVWVNTDKTFIGKMAELTSKGIGLALTSPAFREELSRYLVLPWSSKKRGIAVRSLYIPLPIALIEPLLLRLGINLKAESAIEKKRWLSASGVVCITSEGDLHEDWFAVGRTYLHVVLALEKHGLSHATSAATVEASTFHEDIEALLGTPQRLQSTIRFGKGKSRRVRSPRVATEDLIVTSI